MAENETVFFVTRTAGLAKLAERVWQNTGLEVIGYSSDLGMARMAVASESLGISTLVAGTDLSSQLGDYTDVKGVVDVFRRSSPHGLVVPITLNPGEEVDFGNVPAVFIYIATDGMGESISRLGHVIRQFRRPE